jgi:hypothetical protein
MREVMGEVVDEVVDEVVGEVSAIGWLPPLVKCKRDTQQTNH